MPAHPGEAELVPSLPSNRSRSAQVKTCHDIHKNMMSSLVAGWHKAAPRSSIKRGPMLLTLTTMDRVNAHSYNNKLNKPTMNRLLRQAVSRDIAASSHTTACAHKQARCNPMHEETRTYASERRPYTSRPLSQAAQRKGGAGALCTGARARLRTAGNA